MFIKALLSAPAAALLSFIVASFKLINFSSIEQLGLEFILLGRIPGTEFYLQFEHLFIIFAALTWIPATVWTKRRARKLIAERIDGIGEQLELITL